MIAELAMMLVTVQSGNTLSGIAASHSVSLAAIEQANPQFSADYDLIYVGQTVNIPSGNASPGSIAPVYHGQPPAPAPEPQSQPQSQPRNSGSGSYQSCVIQRESGGNPRAVNPSSGAGGLYQFMPSTWRGLGYSGSPQDASVATQDQAFQKLYAQAGTSPWTPSDGC